MAELLIVDDDPAIRRMLERTLTAEGYEVRTAPTAGRRGRARGSLPDAVVLDIVMPGIDGLHVAERVRAKGLALPILFLTARDSVPDRVAGFESGGDDYLAKPFATAELLVRLRALLKRTRPPGEELARYNLRLDPSSRRVRRGGREIRLTARESGLLELLLREAGRTVTRAEALRVVWAESDALPNIVDRYVAYLRRKLGEPPVIETVRGAGFRIG